MFVRQQQGRINAFKRHYFTVQEKAIWLVAQGANINVNGIPTKDKPHVVIRHFSKKQYDLKHHARGECAYGHMDIWILIKRNNE